ncbi:hypothetical protein [Tenacibaculum sp. 190524A05c]|uniref:hypothetical protein n=1 Tax=Tenacibaculum platacis TaxID=3137852 RepID=UPI0032B24B5D
MNKPNFLFLLLGASYASIKFAKEFVKNDLKPEFKYDLELDISPNKFINKTL